MRAQVGDQLVADGADSQRVCEIIQLNHATARPPYVVRWLNDGHIARLFPGPYARLSGAQAGKHTTTADGDRGRSSDRTGGGRTFLCAARRWGHDRNRGWPDHRGGAALPSGDVAGQPVPAVLQHEQAGGRAGSEHGCAPRRPDHAALLALLDGDVVGLASYEPTATPGVAEVAFAVADDMHGRGIATLLLEHLVSLGQARRVQTFAATTLPENTAMLRVFADAGLSVRRRLAEDVIELTMPIPRESALGADSVYLDAVAGREQRADVASLAPLLAPRSVGGGGGRPPAEDRSGGRSCSTSATPVSPVPCTR